MKFALLSIYLCECVIIEELTNVYVDLLRFIMSRFLFNHRFRMYLFTCCSLHTLLSIYLYGCVINEELTNVCVDLLRFIMTRFLFNHRFRMFLFTCCLANVNGH